MTQQTGPARTGSGTTVTGPVPLPGVPPHGVPPHGVGERGAAAPDDAAPPPAGTTGVPTATGRTTAPPGAGDVLGEHYRLDARIGHGGSADVWRGRDLRLDRTVAVKVFRPGSTVTGARDLAEAQARAAIDDPAAVAVLDVSTGGPERYVVTELVEGDDLGAHIARGPMRPDLARRVAADVAGALATLHARGLAHGGVKPPAILVLRGAAEGDGLAAKLNDVGVAPDTAAALPNGRRPGPADDVRALGLVLLASLLGGRAFRRALERAEGGTPDFGHDVSAEAGDLLRRMIDPDPGARPGAIEVARMLRHDLVGRMTRAESGSTAPVPLAPGAAGLGPVTAPITGAPALFGVPTGGVPVTGTVAVPVTGRRRVPLVAILATGTVGAVLVAATAIVLALTGVPVVGKPLVTVPAATGATARSAAAPSGLPSEAASVPVAPATRIGSASATALRSSAPVVTRSASSTPTRAVSSAAASASSAASSAAPTATSRPSDTATDGATAGSETTPTDAAGVAQAVQGVVIGTTAPGR